jgi:hypothetical protein
VRRTGYDASVIQGDDDMATRSPNGGRPEAFDRCGRLGLTPSS